jgi:hypothetical protein
LRTRQRDEFLGEGRRVDGGPGGGLRAHGRRHLPRALKRAPGAAAGRRLAHFGSKRTSLVEKMCTQPSDCVSGPRYSLPFFSCSEEIEILLILI